MGNWFLSADSVHFPSGASSLVELLLVIAFVWLLTRAKARAGAARRSPDLPRPLKPREESRPAAEPKVRGTSEEARWEDTPETVVPEVYAGLGNTKERMEELRGLLESGLITKEEYRERLDRLRSGR